MNSYIIPGFSYYRITIDGYVNSIEREVLCSDGKREWTQRFHAHEIKWKVNKHRNNETTVYITDDTGVLRHMKVSHLMALAFPEICGVLFEGCDVDHIDTNRLNNNAYNLRVVDRKGNMNNPKTLQHCSDAWNKDRRETASNRMKGDNNPTRKPGYWSEERRKKQAESQKERYRKQREVRNGSIC